MKSSVRPNLTFEFEKKHLEKNVKELEQFIKEEKNEHGLEFYKLVFKRSKELLELVNKKVELKGEKEKK